MNDETLEEWRYYFQRILVPCVVIIGILGNFVNVIVLTRRRMRCSTNVYLTALAVSDIVFLFFVFIISLQHYPNWHSIKYELYWRTYGISHWFCDAAAYTSIYLTVSFTIERYIVVCHPLRGQIYIKNSTKNAKRVISVVVILCFLSTVTTSLEYQLSVETKYVDKSTGELCTNFTYIAAMEQRQATNQTSSSSEFLISNDTIFDGVDHVKVHGTNSGDYDVVDTFLTDANHLVTSENVSTLINVPILFGSGNLDDDGVRLPCTTDVLEQLSLYVIPSSLGESETYQRIFFLFTSIVFVFLPLILLGTFNCFLVSAVRRSHKMRHKMTNARSVNDAMSAQENKITIILIAVVVLFLICQTPTAVNLLYIAFAKPSSDKGVQNLQKALGNLMNFLITLNAACNFLLYCALSDKYRNTIKSLFVARKPQRQNTLTSRFSRCASKRMTSSFHGAEHFPPKENCVKRIPSIPTNSSSSRRPSLIPPNGSRGSVMRLPRVSITQRPSLTPSDILNINKNSSRKSSAASIQLRISSIGTPLNVTCNNSTPHNHCLLQPSESQTSLTRSQSMIIPSSIRHAPDCKSHPDNMIGGGVGVSSGGCNSTTTNPTNHNKNEENDEMVQNNNNNNNNTIDSVNDKK